MKKLVQVMAVFMLVFVLFTGTIFAEGSTAATSKTMKEMKLSKAEKDKLDTFFSNFSELSLDYFAENKVKAESLLYFGIYHNWVNNDKVFKIEGNYATINESNVFASINYFFGINAKISVAIKATYGYKSGKYKIECATGEAYKFSQLDKMYSLGNNLYSCYVSSYVASSGFTGDSHKPLSELQKDEENDVSLNELLTAKIKKVTEKGFSRYILLSYEKRKK